MHEKFLEFTQEDKILLVTLHNPPENKLTSELFLKLRSRRNLFLSSDIDLIIFSGGKGDIFSKGFDLEYLKACANHQQMKAHLADYNEMYSFIEGLSKPVIAAINGHCLGGGLELALVCHYRLCTEKARLGLPEVSLGVIPGLGGVHRLAKLVGYAKALEMITMGDIITSSEALRINLVNRIFPKEGFMSHVLRFAETLLMADQKRVREVIRLLRESEKRNQKENIDAAINSFTHLYFTKRGTKSKAD
jgi:enoyl-CoA hydratase/carnithine racemase